jgi:diadenosine tetraphosphatase ApaH/serine/threonine PP2A family protein phosphatase
MDGVVKAAIPEPGEILDLNVWPKLEETDAAGGPRMIINPGSVGQPRDGDPRSAYMVLDIPDSATSADWDWTARLTFWRIEYPIGETQEIMRGLGFPQRLIARLDVGL